MASGRAESRTEAAVDTVAAMLGRTSAALAALCNLLRMKMAA